MPDTFKAIVITRGEDKVQSVAVGELSDADLMDGDVTVRVEAATVNYKDGLAITGKAPVVRRFPMVPGIDFAGTVLTSDNPDWKPGLKGDWLVPLPEGMSAGEAMAIGTAGYTAMLAVMALERHEITPERGPVVVTGASGGVGTVAISLLSRLGYHVIASTGRVSETAFLRDLGAAEIIDRRELSGPAQPLARERWAGAIDAVGSTTLANVLSMTSYGGAVAACGLAQGMDLPASVAPFILRGVSLLGIDSVMAPRTLRLEAWRRLATELDRSKLAALSTTIGFGDIIQAGQDILEGKIRGRVVVAL